MVQNFTQSAYLNQCVSTEDFSVSFVKSENDDVATRIRDKTEISKSNRTQFPGTSPFEKLTV